MNIDKQALREVATVATQGGWYIDYDFDVCHESGAFLAETHGDNLAQNAKFIAAANPATILALLDELEHYKSREERVTKLVLDNSASWDALYKKLEAAEKHIAELEARKVNLSKLNVGEVMHMSGFS
ncbi:ead/Ea22-like family protein, partial [Salmonella enterica subsp. enterica]|nr:ead/Ea22-like family protein [Salmonella enterica subsp. enterica]